MFINLKLSEGEVCFFSNFVYLNDVRFGETRGNGSLLKAKNVLFNENYFFLDHKKFTLIAH